MNFRKTIFWIHLVSGLVSGVVIAIMSATGIAIAFEHEILDWIDRDVNHVEEPINRTTPLPIEFLIRKISTNKPDFKTSTVIVPSAPDEAYTFRAGRSGSIYVDPYTAEIREPASTGTHDFLHMLEDWHRWLGMTGDSRIIGKMINGVSNLAFLLLCLTGLYLWFPRKWSSRALRPILWFVGKYKGKARDFNWHNVFGFWNLPVLIILVATAVVFSFGWAHKLVFTLAGEEAPTQRGPGMLAGPPITFEAPETNESLLSYDAILGKMKSSFPSAELIGINLPSSSENGEAKPLSVTLFEPALFSTKGMIQLQVDPYRGDILQKIGFEDRTPGTRARIWIRFLHTGEAFGLWGKIIATIATAASLVLVYTGFALSYRRFSAKASKRQRQV